MAASSRSNNKTATTPQTADEQDEFSAPQTATPPAQAPAGGDGSSADDTGVSDAEKLADAERERDEATAAKDETLRQLAEALGIEPGEEDVLAKAVEKLGAETPPPAAEEKPAGSTAIRVTLEEVDGAGAPLRKWGVTVPIAQANPTAVAEVVKRTVEEIVAVPTGPVQALEVQSLDSDD